MDAYTLRAITIAGAYMLAYVLAFLVGLLGISTYMRQLARRYLNDSPSHTPAPAEKAKLDHGYRRLASIIGSLESAMYTTSVLAGRPEFIGVWLVLKAVGEWRQPPATAPGETALVGASKEYTVFLIGNALNVTLGVFTAFLIRGLLPPFPSLAHWQLLPAL